MRPLFAAICKGDSELVRQHLDSGEDPNAESVSWLFHPSEAYNRELIKGLVKGVTALCGASLAGDETIVTHLLLAGAEVARANIQVS
jgi:ankyrin repeat protein